MSAYEQRAIAHILGTLDDKIELNRRMSQTLEEMARALFQSWFNDFDPVRRNMARKAGRNQPSPPTPLPMGEGRLIGRGEGVDEGLAFDHLFPDSFQESELGPIPKGWSVGRLGDVASLNPESWSKETRPETIKYVDLSNTKWGRIEAISEYLQDDAPSRAQRVLRPMDTIIGTVRPGNGSYALITQFGLTGSTGFAVLRPQKAEYAEFVYLSATHTDVINRLAHLADGGAYPAVRPDVVAAIPVVKAPGSVIERFSAFTEQALERMAAIEEESSTVADARNTLLPKLISGELRVKDAEKFLKTRGII